MENVTLTKIYNRLGMLEKKIEELETKYVLISEEKMSRIKQEVEDELVLKKVLQMDEEIITGKRKLLPLAEVKKKYPGEFDD